MSGHFCRGVPPRPPMRQLLRAVPENDYRGWNLMSFRHNRFFPCFCVLALCLGACGSPGVRGDSSGESVTVVGALSCVADNDCDGDGVFAVCDEDDGDSDAMAVSAACDEDEDGYADTPCTTFVDIDGDGLFGDAERVEYGVNCDACPGMYDPDQEDADADGVGDLCVAVNESLLPDVSLNAMPPEEPDEGDAENEGGEDESEVDVNDGESVTADSDGDGLAESVDPDPATANAWGYIDADDSDDPGCVPEKSYNDYFYVRGTTILAMGEAAAAKGGAVSMTKAPESLGLAAQGFKFVSGADKSAATLPTYACVGASAAEEFDYGIYVVSLGSVIRNSPAVVVNPDGIPVAKRFKGN